MEAHASGLSPIARALLGSALTATEPPADLDAESWKCLVSDARGLGVVPQLARAWSDDERCPRAVRARLRELQQRHSFWNLQLFDELARVLEELERRSIEVIALKGAHLAELVYRDRTLRSMADVDLLVHPESLAELEEALTGLGYRPPSTGERRWSETSYYHFVYYHAKKGLPVEVHWDVLAPYSALRVDLDGWWRRSQKSSIAGQAVRILSPEDLLLYVTLHAGWKHRFEGCLRALCDLQAIVEAHPDLDWEKLTDQVSASKQAARCAALMLGAARVAGVEIPEDVLGRLPPIDQPQLIDTVIERATSVSSGAWAEKLRLVESAGSVRSRARVTASTLRFSVDRLWRLATGKTRSLQRWRMIRWQILRQLGTLVRFSRRSRPEDSAIDRWLAGD